MSACTLKPNVGVHPEAHERGDAEQEQGLRHEDEPFGGDPADEDGAAGHGRLDEGVDEHPWFGPKDA